jgi:hypothetical protein
MTEVESPRGYSWLRLLSGLIIAVMTAALLYTVIISLLNFQRIGV